MTTYDVIVVGGGPAGLSAAAAAARAGATVLVLERAAAFGEPVRTSGGSFVKPLKKLGIPSRYWQPVHELVLIGPGHVVRRRWRRAQMCVLDIRGLYQWLAAEAATAGAELRLKSLVASSLTEDDRVVGVRLRSGEELRAATVIDASGRRVRSPRTRVCARPRRGPRSGSRSRSSRRATTSGKRCSSSATGWRRGATPGRSRAETTACAWASGSCAPTPPRTPRSCSTTSSRGCRSSPAARARRPSRCTPGSCLRSRTAVSG